MREVVALVDKVCRIGTTVLVQGENGTGKELVHAQSTRTARAGAPLRAVNCAELDEGILESELFGHKRGAFTGGRRRQPRPLRVPTGHRLPGRDSRSRPRLQATAARPQEAKSGRVGARATAVDVRVVAHQRKLEEGEGGAVPRGL